MGDEGFQSDSFQQDSFQMLIGAPAAEFRVFTDEEIPALTNAGSLAQRGEPMHLTRRKW